MKIDLDRALDCVQSGERPLWRRRSYRASSIGASAPGMICPFCAKTAGTR
jgi:hypothetical protein